MKVIKGIEEMASYSEGARKRGKTIAFVPTMGYLHDGHRELLRVARASGDIVVLSIFVNPAQFGPGEDYRTYPRDMGRDLRIAGDEGVDAVFAPEAGAMYPKGYSTYVEVEGLSGRLCGASRPGHFRGVATVVLKLFNIVRPHKAVFGRKDYQQLLIIERMVRDLDAGVEIIGVDTVREPDGLAMSSRNSYLNEEERRAARAIPEALDAAEREFSRGERAGAAIIGKMKKIIEKEPLAVIDYIGVYDPRTLEDIENIETEALVAVAVKVGKARLIDNRLIGRGVEAKFF